MTNLFKTFLITLRNSVDSLLTRFYKESINQEVEPTNAELAAIEKEPIDLSDEAYKALCDEILQQEDLTIQEYDFLTGETESYSF